MNPWIRNRRPVPPPKRIPPRRMEAPRVRPLEVHDGAPEGIYFLPVVFTLVNFGL